MKTAAIPLLLLAVACNASETEPASTAPPMPPSGLETTKVEETIEPTGTPTEKETDHSSGPPERVFHCSRPASVTSDFVGQADDDPSLRFEIRYTTGCSSTLWLHHGSDVTPLDAKDRVHTVGAAALVDGVRVACFGVMALGKEVPHSEGVGRFIDSTQIECATLKASGWTQPVEVLKTSDHATWLMGIEASSEGKPLLVTVRDSLFSPSVMSMRGRPATDGFWQHDLTQSGGVVQLSHDKQRAPFQFENR